MKLKPWQCIFKGDILVMFFDREYRKVSVTLVEIPLESWMTFNIYYRTIYCYPNGQTFTETQERLWSGAKQWWYYDKWFELNLDPTTP